MKFTWFVFAAVVCPNALISAPVVLPNGVVQAATLAPPGLPNAPIAQGALFSIYGTGLGPASFRTADAYPLKEDLAGVTITVAKGNQTVKAIPVFVSPGQINAIMPSNAPLGRVALKVTFNNESSEVATVEVMKSNFGTFAVNSAGFGPGVIQNFIAADNQPVNSLTQSAKPGMAIVLWGSGLGPVPNDTVAPTAGDLPTPVQILVGGKAGTKLYGGRAPCCSGLDQIVFTLPQDVPLGCYVPVQIVTDGTVPGSVTTMAISADGSACRDEINPYNFAPLTGGRIGSVLLSRTANYNRVRGTVTESQADTGLATFRTYAAGNQFAFEPRYSFPPVGTCTVYTARAESINDPAFIAKFTPAFTSLDAGVNLSVSTPSRTGTLPREAAGARDYSATLGGSVPGFNLTFLASPGIYTVAGTGGAQVGAFSAALDTLPAINWTNRNTIASIDRSQPLRLTWEVTNTGAVGAAVQIVGASSNIPRKAAAMFQCVARAADGAFTVPVNILRTLPETNRDPRFSTGVLGIGVMPPQGTSFTANNLDTGVAVMTSTSVATVTVK